MTPRERDASDFIWALFLFLALFVALNLALIAMCAQGWWIAGVAFGLLWLGVIGVVAWCAASGVTR